MTDTEKSLRRIEALLMVIAAKMGAELPVKPKPMSAASVTNMRELGSEDIPSQLTHAEREAMRWVERPTRRSSGPRVDRQPVPERGR